MGTTGNLGLPSGARFFSRRIPSASLTGRDEAGKKRGTAERAVTDDSHETPRDFLISGLRIPGLWHTSVCRTNGTSLVTKS
jgi:hypothetical protein